MDNYVEFRAEFRVEFVDALDLTLQGTVVLKGRTLMGSCIW